MADKQLDTFYPKNRNDWREWLDQYHDKKESIWLIYDKKVANKQRINWSEAVEEALCFGWIDSRSRPIDDGRYMQFFSKRKVKSAWSKINKDKVELLEINGLMKSAGLKCIEMAKQNGSWEMLDGVEALIIPEDLLVVLDEMPAARIYFDSLSKSVKKQLLLRLVVARKEETRKKRIAEIREFLFGASR
ncbi:hypothetical protein DBR11_27090 [Pedobacter sp. HMWF019]|uniref:YdeI/OmpD-associated family protein n=1 Tax=Pedobacter sp. HMWF019 TaxID=2056856 RepID=UPI000D3A108A|nr:YdeI/OmpD-associated family protein [Pedobacter sp. HMWF019]PTS92364.1 hypothetical protein DBR11_27090 [Pedobacter sp. HMWF019]